MADAYSKIAETLLAGALDAKTWTPPWHCHGLTTPINAITGRAYAGVNILTCWASQQQRGYASQRWATYQQWSEAGAQVQKGEKATPIVFWKALGDETTPKEDRRWIARGFSLFNRDQVVNPPPLPDDGAPELSEAERLAGAETFLASLRQHAVIHERDQDRAYYDRRADEIVLPLYARFKHAAGFYGTALHELTHWTGHESREARTFGKRFGDDAYALEELVAELSATFLCCDLGIEIEPREDHASYIGNWYRILNNDHAAFANAVSAARKAATYLHQLAEQEGMRHAA